MSESRLDLILCRFEEERFTLEALATRAGLHPTVLEALVDYGLLEPVERVGTHVVFDATSLERLRTIERLRRDLGVNLAGIAVILDLRDRLSALQHEVTLWRRRSF